MEENLPRKSVTAGRTPTPSSLRHCLYPLPVPTVQSESKSLRHNPKSINNHERPRPPALTRVKGRINMETPTRMGSDVSWLHDESPMVRTPRTSQSRRSRNQTPDPNSTSLVNPSSALLQDLLKEQRASRGARSAGLEELEDGAPRTPERRQSQSRTHSQEESGSGKQQAAKVPLSGSLRQPRDMGIRETDQYVSKISKENFDLKLEIFHRLQQISALEQKLERMHELEEELERMRGLEDELQELRAAEEDNQRLRESNEQLRHEIDKRDQAVTEAVQLICELEARVEKLEMGRCSSRASTVLPLRDGGSPVSTPRNASTPDIPERTSSKRGTRLSERRRVSSRSHSLQRAPSFLLDESKNTAALRSLYVQPDEQPVSEIRSITKSESVHSMTETVEPASPRLSALSECSELNVNDDLSNCDVFDKLEIPVRRGTGTETVTLSSSTLGNSDCDLNHINRWVPAQANHTLPVEVAGRKTRRLSDVFKGSEKPSPDSSCNSSSQKTKLDSIFGNARLPPTPDTMNSVYAGWANRSSTSTVEDKSRTNQKRGLVRARSADELTTRRSSVNSEPIESLNTNVSDVTLPRPSLDERHEDPAIFPLNSVQTRYDSSAGPSLFYGDFEKVLARMENDYYSPTRGASRATYRDGSVSPGSPRQSLTAEDWVEAARSGTATERTRAGPLPANSRLVGARMPGQSSFLGRRHSIDSAVSEPDLPVIQTLNLRALEGDALPTEPDPEPRRKISLLPPFFSRSSTMRRLQPSPMTDPLDKDDGAPSPVIRKTRNPTSKAPRPLSGHGDFGASGPTYAHHKDDHMSRSLTEAFFIGSSNTSTMTARPSTSNGKDHKRRGSLGLFGWMKGGSIGLCSLKKPETSTAIAAAAAAGIDCPVTPTSASGNTTVRASSRLATHENTTLPRETAKHAEPAVDDYATRTRHPTRTDEPADEQGRRPRYMERRSRRV